MLAMDSLGKFAQVTVGCVLCIAGLFYLRNEWDFFVVLTEYRLLPGLFVRFISTFLPMLQMIIGICLVASLYVRRSLIISTMMFSCFAIAEIFTWFRGLDISCGCFGPMSPQVGVTSIALTTIMGLLSFVAFLIVQET